MEIPRKLPARGSVRGSVQLERPRHMQVLATHFAHPRGLLYLLFPGSGPALYVRWLGTTQQRVCSENFTDLPGIPNRNVVISQSIRHSQQGRGGCFRVVASDNRRSCQRVRLPWWEYQGPIVKTDKRRFYRVLSSRYWQRCAVLVGVLLPVSGRVRGLLCLLFAVTTGFGSSIRVPQYHLITFFTQ